MNKHLVRPHPAPLTPAGVAQLHADATNWRALLSELAERGFTDMTLDAIIAVFPDFRGLAGLRKCVDGGGPHVAAQPGGAATPPGPQSAFDLPALPARAATAASASPARPRRRPLQSLHPIPYFAPARTAAPTPNRRRPTSYVMSIATLP